ncbi:hypothetical protein BJX61DRAFT_229434 [Aspergillus egyptiacus]|nr:hypothetical protein BJX61DRAFT_229434 [Aspergillus egyptiacus]
MDLRKLQSGNIQALGGHPVYSNFLLQNKYSEIPYGPLASDDELWADRKSKPCDMRRYQSRKPFRGYSQGTPFITWPKPVTLECGLSLAGSSDESGKLGNGSLISLSLVSRRPTGLAPALKDIGCLLSTRYSDVA